MGPKKQGRRMTKEDLNRVKVLAVDMASYIHHIGYPVYDGGHTEPEITCQHPDCKAVREFVTEHITKEESE